MFLHLYFKVWKNANFTAEKKSVYFFCEDYSNLSASFVLFIIISFFLNSISSIYFSLISNSYLIWILSSSFNLLSFILIHLSFFLISAFHFISFALERPFRIKVSKMAITQLGFFAGMIVEGL